MNRKDRAISFKNSSEVWIGADSRDGQDIIDEQLQQLFRDLSGIYPLQKVHLEPFAIDQYPVMKGEWRTFVEQWSRDFHLSSVNQLYWERILNSPGYREDSPIVGVSFEEANAFALLNGGRLPYEEEIEYVLKGKARSGKVTAKNECTLPDFPFGFEDGVKHLRSVTDMFTSEGSQMPVYLLGNCDEIVDIRGYRPQEEGSTLRYYVTKILGARSSTFRHYGFWLAPARHTRPILRADPQFGRLIQGELATFRCAYDL